MDKNKDSENNGIDRDMDKTWLIAAARTAA